MPRILNSLQNGFDFLRIKIVEPLGLGADISGLGGTATNVTEYHLQEIESMSLISASTS